MIKTNIMITTKLLSTHELLLAIDNFYYETGCLPHYLVMNKETYSSLLKESREFVAYYHDGVYERKFEDINIAFSDSLSFGEIDVV